MLTSHLPGYEVRSVTGLGEGLDNVAYEVNGELIVRVSKEADPAGRSESTRREAELLAVVTGLSTLPVPVPVFVDFEAYARCSPLKDIAYGPSTPGAPLRGGRLGAPRPDLRVESAHATACARRPAILAGALRPDDAPPGAGTFGPSRRRGSRTR